MTWLHIYLSPLRFSGGFRTDKNTFCVKSEDIIFLFLRYLFPPRTLIILTHDPAMDKYVPLSLLFSHGAGHKVLVKQQTF